MKIKPLLSLIPLLFMILAPGLAAAESGCCQVLDDTLGNPKPWHFETMDRAACATVNDPERPDRGWTLSRDRASYYTFDPGKTASYDGQDCLGRTEPAPTAPIDTKASLPVFDAPTLAVSIPGLKPLANITCPKEGECQVPWLAQYISGIQRYGLGIIGILSVIVMMMGGIIWLTSGGNNERISQGQALIKGSLGGLILVLCAYMLLNIINPNLTDLKSLGVTRIEKIDLDLVIADIKNGAPITKEQAELMKKYDKDGIISHTVGSKADTYASMNCSKSMFSGGQAVQFFTTGYYKPPYQNNQKFFCDVGLQCSCPAGSRQLDPNRSICGHGYKYCSPFPAGTDYCNKTSSGVRPEIGQVAADPCFNFGDKLCLGGKITVTVTDRGSAITGRRLDIFSGSDRQAALSKTGLVSVTLGPCK